MIESYSFGRIVVDGVQYNRDIKIIREKVIPDWWRKSGHTVTPADISDIIAAEPEILLLGTGSPGLMKPGIDSIPFLHDKHIALINVPTEEATALFNRLTEEKKNIAAAFHLTC